MINRFGKIMAEAIVFIIVIAGMLFTYTGAAQAAGPCTVESICFYDTSSSNAMIDHDDADTYPGECLHFSPSQQGQTSYVNNRTDHQYHAYVSTNCTGIYGHLWANTAGPMSGAWNNSIASYIRVG